MHYYTNTRTRELKLFPQLGYSEGFMRLWYAYPTVGRKRKSDAFAIFLRMNLENGKLEEVIKSIELHKQTSKWQGNDGKFVPTIGNFLYYKRFEDEIDEKEISWEVL